MDGYQPRYGGGVTSFETLLMGKPLVTLAHHLLPGRFTYSFYAQMGVYDCVAFNASECALLVWYRVI